MSNFYGSVTSLVATLKVTSTAVPPAIGSLQNLTNYVGNNQNITAIVSGTDPKGGYQWYFNGALLDRWRDYRRFDFERHHFSPTLSILQGFDE